MKGLILKDAYILLKICKTYFFIAAIFIIAALIGENGVGFLFYPCLLSGLLPISILSYDEQNKWDVYSGTLPCSRTLIVSGKYLISLITSTAIVLTAGVSQAIKMAVSGTFVLSEFMKLICVLVTMSLFTPALLFPSVFKLGVEKGRLFYFFIVGFIVIIYMVILGLRNFLIDFGSVVALIFFAVSIITYALSWSLSVHFYKKREF